MARYPAHTQILPRLRRIEGQVRGIARMVEGRRALDQVSLKVMSHHINTCVSEAIRKREGAGKVNELMQTITRFVK
ncbi:MAG: metal-sensitive transcriptional regulator [Candidatus Omnitrophica bacterium]|nr:metal-sensitive transcriptional regulator [Candidatus Omnitrophota bacterium]